MKRRTIVVGVISLMLIALAMSAFAQEKPASIKLMVDGTFQVKENGEQALVDSFKALTGIDLVLNHPVHNEYYTKVNLAFTTGDIPDVLILGGNNYVRYAEAGALVDLTDLYNKSDFKKRINDLAIIEALKIDGKLYGIPFERGNGCITYVRGDWLEKLNLKPPTNYTEFLNMLRLFKNKNPDGLPPEKVIPITSAGLVNSEYPLDIYLREFYQDATPDFVMRGGKWVDGMSEPAMIRALSRMRVAYSEGLIDKEIVTNKTSNARDKWATGTVGVFNYWAGTWNLNLTNLITKNVPTAKVTPIPPIKETKYIERPATVYAITTKAKNPAGIFKYFHEFILDGGKGSTWATFGPEGIFHKVEDGKLSFLPSIQDPKKAFTKAVISPELPIIKWNSGWTPDPLISSSLAMFQANNVAYGLLPASEKFLELLPELNLMKTQYVTKIVFGEMTITDGLAAYKKDSDKYVKAILAEINKKK
jgi:putative aldouronate transport system substrate-binding protein